MPAYHKAFNKVFYKKNKDSQHVKYKDFKTQLNNNRIERYHGTLKDRTRVMRGRGDMDTAKNTADGFALHYNYIRKQEGLGFQTPAQASKINLLFEDGWGDLIYWSSVHHTEHEWTNTQIA